MKRLALAVLGMTVMVAAAGQPTAPVVTRCTNPSGHAYFYAGGVVQGKDAGWHKDAITNGQFLLLRDKDGGLDIVFTDAFDQTLSTKGDGGRVLVAQDTQTKVVILVLYPGMSIETWMFALDARGVGHVSVSQARYGDAAVSRKHSLMTADCRR